jgi:TonB family protein
VKAADMSAMPDDFVSELFAKAAQRRSLRRVAWLVAFALHAGVGLLALRESHAATVLAPPLEIELAPPPSTPEPPPPVVKAPAAEPERVAAARPAVAAPPEPARAAALLTAKADPQPTPNADEPVDFTNDPSMLGFGSGVVAVGGRAEHGVSRARPSAPGPVAGVGQGPRTSGDAITPVSDLSRKPSLGESDPCRGYFPGAANDDVASAAVMVTIGKDGAVSGVQLLSESPPQQGFGAAARACMNSKRFSPGLDRDGRPAKTQVRVNVRFTR